VILLGHIVHTRGGEASHGDAAQLVQHANRQTRSGNYLRVCSLAARHPDRYRQRSAVGAPHDIVGFVVEFVQPDHRQAVRAQRVEAVVDCNFSSTLLMGSMSFSCSRRSNKI
jgi:hypothetical protein